MPPSGRARPVVLAGRVTSTDGRCTVFKSDRDGHRWVLVGGTERLEAGKAYRLQGVAMDTMDPACPQGLPFHVNDAEAVPFEPGRPLPPSTPPGEPVTLTGVVDAGVESGCRILRTDEGVFLLLGTVSHPDGTRVTVKGTRRDNVMSTCQQGPPVEVQSVTKAG